MQFNAINLFGLAIVAIMMIPNCIYAVRFRGAVNRCNNKLMNAAEQLGRYGSFALMFLPLLVWEFSFNSVAAFLVYALGNSALLLAYLVVWVFYLKKQTPQAALALAILPTCIFLLCGITLQHILLIIAAATFGVGHIYVSCKNNKP